MSEQPIDTEGASNAKKPKICDLDPNKAAIELVAAEADESPPQIFELNIECYDAIADWLSLKDLHSFGQTCTYYERIAGDIFKKVNSSAHAVCKSNGIYIGNAQVNGFCNYIQHLFISDEMDCFRFVESHKFESLKRIRIVKVDLTDEKIACIKKILSKIEIVELIECKLDGEFHDEVLQFCENMKRLTVRRRDCYDPENYDFEEIVTIIGTDNNWLLGEYPKLDRFELTGIGYFTRTPETELKSFLQRNPNIRHFATSADYFSWKDEDGVKLDVFAIDCNDDTESLLVMDILRYHSELGEKNRFYERLDVYSYGLTAGWHMEYLISMKRMEKLYIHCSWVTLNLIPNLKELRIECGPGVISNGFVMEEHVVNGLSDLERVSLATASIGDILAIIRASPKLVQLRIESFHDTVRAGERILDLLAWNDQRATLNGAQKVTIYVEEEAYLATKWAIHKTDFELVKLERDQSNDWGNDFGF